MGNYIRATLVDGSKVMLYRCGNQGLTQFYFVVEVYSGAARLSASVARVRGSSRYFYEEMV